MPVVPPVYRSSRSSGERPHGVSTRSAPPCTTGSYSTAHAGTGAVPSATQYQRRTVDRRFRTPARSSPKVAWKTTASASALSNR
jgi:hypothetical protein